MESSMYILQSKEQTEMNTLEVTPFDQYLYIWTL